MNADTLFNITCIIAAIGWLVILFASPFWFGFDKFIVSIIIVILALVYSYCNFSNPDPEILQKFSTLDGIGNLFQNKMLLLACWIHIMVFDLLGAVWIKKNARQHGISHGLIIVPLIFTCLLGPLGLLLYLLVRWIKTKQYFAENSA
jgi:hypothetical protein